MRNLFILLAISAMTSSFGQRIETTDQLHLKSGVFGLQDPIEDLSSLPFFDGKAQLICTFQAFPTEYQRSELRSSGIGLPFFLDGNSYLAVVDEAMIYSIPTGLSFYPFDGDMKLSEELAAKEVPFHAQRGEEIMITAIHLKNFTHRAILQDLQNRGIRILEERSSTGEVGLLVSWSELEEIKTLPYFYFLSPIAPAPEPENYIGRTDHRINQLSPDHGLWQYDGSGVNVAMGDDGTIGPHIDYQGRIDQTYASPSSGSHGDHVAGIIMGAGNLDPYGRGNAPGAFLYVYDPFDNIYYSPSHYTQHDIRITSTSYSNGCNLGYSSFARFVDSTIRVHESLMHVASAGNNGSQSCTYATYPLYWGNVTGGFKVGKNAIAVANLDARDNLAASSSRGPARDGRIKPDVAAVGTSVYSTVSTNMYDSYTGTSMSCPGVSGILASLYHAYKEIGDGTDPHSGLIKSIIMNTAEDLGRPGPDFEYGYGRVNAKRALEIIEDSTWFSSTTSTNDVDTFMIDVPPGTSKARFMLYWADYEGLENAAIPLVNDLQLQVVDPNDNLYDPWILDHSPNVASLTSNAVRGVDTINNVEQVTLLNPAAGTYLFIVKGVSVPQGPQLFFGNYYMDPEYIVLTNPAGGEGWAPGTSELIRWDTQDDSTDVDIHYSIDNGSSWYSIATGLNPDDLYYEWSVPDSISDEVIIRVEQGIYSYENSMPVTILGVPSNVAAAFVCSDSLSLNWTAVAGADGYIIRRLGAEYMDSIAFVGQNFGLITGHNNQVTNWYTVQAIYGSGKGAKAVSIEVPPGEFNCNSDLAVLAFSPQGVINDCNVGGKLPVVAQLVSLSPKSFSNFNISFEINGTIYSDSIVDTIGPGAVYLHEFTDSLNPGSGLNYYELWHDLTDDVIANDTDHVYLEFRDSLFTPTLTESFDQMGNCGTNYDCGLTLCDLGAVWYNHINDLEDDIDWRVNSGSTPSGGTGPSIDHTTGTSSGKYVYLEASNGCTGHTALLSSPCIDLGSSQLPVLHFYYHMYGMSTGTLSVDIQSNGQWDLNVWSLSGDQGNQWIMGEVDLSPYSGDIIQIRFRGTTGSSYDSDIALDDIEVFEINSAPVVDFTSNVISDCLCSTIELTDLSTNMPSIWEWVITPSTFQFVNGTDAFSQNPQVVFSDTGFYSIKLIAANTFGSDSLTQSQWLYMSSGEGLPLMENFDLMSLCGTGSNCELEVCPLDNGWTNMTNNMDDDIDWRVNSGNTPSSNTGPTDDVSGGGRYLYLEASGNPICSGKEAILLSPCIDLNLPLGYTPQLYFSYHMYGPDMGELEIDIWSDGVWYNDIGPNLSGDQGNMWHTDTLSLSNYVNTNIKLRFRGIIGSNYGSDLAIDHIGITPGEPLAIPDFDVVANPPCTNENFVFTDISTGNVNSYDWNFGPGAFPATANGPGPHTVQYITPGAKMVELSLTNGGGTSSTTQQVDVVPGPNSAFSYSVPVVGTYDFMPIDSSHIDSVLWNFGDGSSSQILNPSHTYSTNGTYLVNMKAWGPCGITTTSQNVVVTGIGMDEWLAESGFRIYPNPADHSLFLVLDSCPSERLNIKIMDVQGRTIQNRAFDCRRGVEIIDVSSLSSGVYQIEITDGTNRTNERLVIQ